jgi:hypothetical protein
LFKSLSIGDERNKSEFIKKIEKCLYNGAYLENDRDLRKFYGIRYIPEDFETVNSLKSELAKIRNSYKKIKKEKDEFAKKNEILKKMPH